jgi:hypothetical protein
LECTQTRAIYDIEGIKHASARIRKKVYIWTQFPNEILILNNLISNESAPVFFYHMNQYNILSFPMLSNKLCFRCFYYPYLKNK